jgi:hypothetical protein
MQLQQVDVIRAEPAQCVLDRPDQAGTGRTGVVRCVAHRQRGLGGDEHLIATALESLSENLFRGAIRVDVGRIEQGSLRPQGRYRRDGGLPSHPYRPRRRTEGLIHRRFRLRSSTPAPRDRTLRDICIRWLVSFAVHSDSRVFKAVAQMCRVPRRAGSKALPAGSSGIQSESSASRSTACAIALLPTSERPET